MLSRKGLSAISIGLLLLTAGCSSLFGSSTSQNEQAAENAVNEDGLVAITDYTGEGYGLNGHDEEEELALANREEVEEAAKSYMKEFYNTDVEVQRIFGSPGAVTVIVRAAGEVPFNTYVIVPVDVENEKIEADQTFSEKSQVEGAIVSGLYYLAYEEQLMNYEKSLEKLVKKNDLSVMQKETVDEVRFSGYSSSYITINMSYKDFEDVLTTYLENPDTGSAELRGIFNSLQFDTKYMNIHTELYMGKEEQQPDPEVYEEIYQEIKQNSDLPRGRYALTLHNHFIDPVAGFNNTGDSILTPSREDIIKE